MEQKDNISEIKEFLGSIDYLKSVVQSTTSISKLDKNTLYELFYSHLMLKDILNSGISDSVIKSEVVDLEKKFSILVDTIPEKTVNELLNSKKYKSNLKIDKTKYANKAGFKGEYKAESYTYIKNPLNIYLISKVPSILALGICMLLLLTNSTGGINNAFQVLPAELIKAIEILRIILGSFSSLLLITLWFRFVVDILYITNSMQSSNKEHPINPMASESAKNILNKEYDKQLTFYQVREPDKIKRNTEMLKILMKKYPDSIAVTKLQDIIEHNRGKKKYYALARVEYLYDQDLKGNTDIFK